MKQSKSTLQTVHKSALACPAFSVIKDVLGWKTQALMGKNGNMNFILIMNVD